MSFTFFLRPKKENSSAPHLLHKMASILQFSPCRSGSTLVYNLLKEIFPDRKINKVHTLGSLDEASIIVSTIRHPCESIVSVLKLSNLAATDKNVKAAFRMYLQAGGQQMAQLDEKTLSKMLILRYEDFFENYDVVFDALQKFFAVTIDATQRKDLKAKYNIEEMLKTAHKYRDFSQYDQETFIHGKHISSTKGKSTYKSVLSAAQISMISTQIPIAKIMQKFNYNI